MASTAVFWGYFWHFAGRQISREKVARLENVKWESPAVNAALIRDYVEPIYPRFSSDRGRFVSLSLRV